MGLFEKLVPCKRNDPSQTENIQKCDEKHGNAAPDNIGLVDEIFECGRLGLVETAFDECPSQRVEERLNENDSSQPAVQKVEGLVRNASDKSENRLSR
jgi:hypothetical protein